ncbi:MAG: NAD(P)H-binding protein [Nitrospirae bacterium]|nr:NAD(P)H-binding protein [Nitrospirota bacterium]
MESGKKEATHRVFMTGGTGYLGSRLIPRLLGRGHTVRALVRKESVHKLPVGCEAIVGNPLDADSFQDRVAPADTFVQLVGIPHPAPWKGRLFRDVDRVSARESMRAAKQAGVAHFIYLSVAHPAPVMHAYIAVREWCEIQLRASGLASTILRPWYILGPGHYWPCMLLPAYWLLERMPATQASAQRLGLVTIQQMIEALRWAVEHPPAGQRVLNVPDIRTIGSWKVLP